MEIKQILFAEDVMKDEIDFLKIMHRTKIY